MAAEMKRRDFLKGAAWMAEVASAVRSAATYKVDIDRSGGLYRCGDADIAAKMAYPPSRRRVALAMP